MATAAAEKFRTLYVDPGEDTGWCVGRGTKLLAAGTTKMWEFADEAWASLSDEESIINGDGYARKGVTAEENSGDIGRIVCEDFRIYPWAAKDLAWNSVRTARLIGALTFMARLHGIPFVLQPAAIKEAAVAAGAEELFTRPLHENRHQNDATMHFVYFTNTTLLGLKLPVKTENPAGK